MMYLARIVFLVMVSAVITCVLTFLFVVQMPPVGLLSATNPEVWHRLAGPLSADDPRVLEVLRNNFLDPPSSLPYNFSNRVIDNYGKDQFTFQWITDELKKLFQGQNNGFYVEAGGLDGVYLSNSLRYEKDHAWQGLLIEADKESYKSLKYKQRKAWTSNTCLSSEPFPKKTVMVSRRVKEGNSVNTLYWWAFRGNSHEFRSDLPDKPDLDYMTDSNFFPVQCFPLLSYLLALNVSQVDLLSLDIQGTETYVVNNVLSSGKVSVRVIVAEDEVHMFNHTHMDEQGYVLVASFIDHVYVKKGDRILEREDIQEQIKQLQIDLKERERQKTK